MGYFPFFLELSQRTGLIVGGGQVALRKVEKLLPFGPRLTVVATNPCQALQDLAGITLWQRPFETGDLEGMEFAVAATNDPAVNHSICSLCHERKILVNSVDGGEEGSFLFPALLQQGALTVGISTGGASPSAAAALKEILAAALPPGLEEILADLEVRRQPLRRQIPQGTVRAEAYKSLCRAALAAGRVLTEAEVAKLVGAVYEEDER